jgi:hypothetical protein
LSILADWGKVNAELINHTLTLQVPNLNRTGGGGHKPVSDDDVDVWLSKITTCGLQNLLRT